MKRLLKIIAVLMVAKELKVHLQVVKEEDWCINMHQSKKYDYQKKY